MRKEIYERYIASASVQHSTKQCPGLSVNFTILSSKCQSACHIDIYYSRGNIFTQTLFRYFIFVAVKTVQ